MCLISKRHIAQGLEIAFLFSMGPNLDLLVFVIPVLIFAVLVV
jgi:hypothetical protein